MRPIALALLLGGVATTAQAAPAPTVVTIQMGHRSFSPQIIRLRAGTDYRLRLVNPDRTEHDFHAPDFFASARFGPEEGQKLEDNSINVPGHSVRTFRLTPQRPDHYDLTSTKALDVASGMQGQILVY